MDLDRSISVATKSGKTTLGANAAKKAAMLGDAKAIVIAANAPQDLREDISYYAKLSNIPLIEFPRSSQELGFICGRPHLTAFVTIFNPGDSDILSALS